MAEVYFSTQTTHRRSLDLIETVVTGRVRTLDVERFLRDFVKLGRTPAWLFDATTTTGYEYTAIATAAKGFADLHGQGLRLIAVAVTNPVVLMGARVVALTSKAEMVFRASIAEAREVLRARGMRLT